MTDEHRVSARGIEIPEEVAAAAGVPEDLDANAAGPYRFPSPTRRRTAAAIYAIGAAFAVVVDLLDLVAPSLWVAALLLAGLAVWHLAGAHPIDVDEHRALRLAAAEVPFAVGHASASVRFTGLRGHPRWAVVLYDAAEPPARRALVLLDAQDGSVEATYVEDVPPI